LRREAILGSKTTKKDRFHSAAQVAPHTVQVTRDAGLMLTKRPANLSEGFLLGVVETKSIPFSWLELCEGCAQSTAKQGKVAVTMGIAGMELRSRLKFLTRIVRVVFAEFFEASARANRINVALREDGAEPGLQ